MQNIIKQYLKEIKYFKVEIISIIAIIFFSCFLYLLLDEKTIILIAKEDGFYEWGTAIFFLFASILFFLSFIRTKALLLCLMAVVFFMGFGEEISWGQRLFNIKEPEIMNEINVQHELNLHNIQVFNDQNFGGVKKTGLQRLLEINMWYRVFSVLYLIGVPVYFYHFKWRPIRKDKLRMPVPPVSLGIFFFISWAVFYSLKLIFLWAGKNEEVYKTPMEMFEFTSAFIYFLTSLYFYRNKDLFLARDFKQNQ
jgi:hypothetical protein